MTNSLGRLAVTLIDQRILIDAPTGMIWDYISDPDKVARWHAGYSGVSVLTTQRTGAGTRRRCTSADGGKDVIEEITAWVDGLGYEYSVLESSAYRSFQGRMRLQAGPDGTTVQWTVSYRRRGVIGFFHDQFKGRNRLAAIMADSLRQLRRQIDTMGVRMDADHRAKAGIQGRLDANARAQYQRRFAPPPGLETDLPAPEALEAAARGEAAAALPLAYTDEPLPPATPAPVFVTDLSREEGEPDYEYKADTKPRAPKGLHEAIVQQPAESPAVSSPEPAGPAPSESPAPPEHIEPPAEPITRETAHPSREMLPVQVPEVQPIVEPRPDHQRITPPRGIPVVRPTAAPEAASEAASEAPTEPKAPHEIAAKTPAASDIPAERKISRPPPTPIHDTGEISIWEVFGVKRPSQQDNETIEDLIRSVRQKKSSIRRRVGRRMAGNQKHVRHVEAVIGLRVWLALRSAHIRLNGGQYERHD